MLQFFACAYTECCWEMITMEEMRALATEDGFTIADIRRPIEFSGAIKDQVPVCVAQMSE